MARRSYAGNWYSENGWPIIGREDCALPIVPLEFMDTAPIRRGPALTILSAWLAYYDAHCAPIVSPVWGFSWDNDVANSNHLSGTAVDINAPQWPWGVRKMPADLKARIRRGLELFEGTIYWGADWQRADEMHFQMALPEGDSRNAAFAAKLGRGYLGIYGEGADYEEDEDVAIDYGKVAEAVWGHRITLPDGKSTETAGNIHGWTNQHAGNTLDQLAGPGTRHQRGYDIQPTGWPQLGKTKDGRNRTLVDGEAMDIESSQKAAELNAAVLAELKALRADLAAALKGGE